jgi:hypothetical protein
MKKVVGADLQTLAVLWEMGFQPGLQGHKIAPDPIGIRGELFIRPAGLAK